MWIDRDRDRRRILFTGTMDRYIERVRHNLAHYALEWGLLSLSLFLAFVIGFGAYWLWDGQAQARPMGVFWEAWEHVEQHFYGTIPSAQDRTYGAIRYALLLLDDPYTRFVEPQPRELERDRMRGAFGGIGVTLGRDSEGRLVLFPLSDSPAERAGILAGDLLLEVDGETVSPMSIEDVRALIHGEVDTPVTLTLSRPPIPPFELTIVRDEIQVPSVTWRVLEQAPDVGYIHIERFTERTGDEVLDALQELEQREVTGLALDLRDNAGGLLDPAVATASHFLRSGVVLYETQRDGQERTFPVEEEGIATDVPLVVLVNEGTASAAEIVAGALQDHGRAPLVGQPTFGKGSVQQIYELSDGSSLHVTSAVWLTPDRHQIKGQGLTPTFRVPRGEGSQDEQLDRAVAYLHAQS